MIFRLCHPGIDPQGQRPVWVEVKVTDQGPQLLKLQRGVACW